MQVVEVSCKQMKINSAKYTFTTYIIATTLLDRNALKYVFKYHVLVIRGILKVKNIHNGTSVQPSGIKTAPWGANHCP